ncbi:MAG TPA: AsmA family protein [Terriglobales bacterium]|nr:AsmA family protein [Terriglobales bacterium]
MKRKGLIIAGALLAVLVIAAVALPLLINVDSFRPTIQSEASAALGREVRIGKLDLSLLAGGVTASDLSIADDPAYNREPFLQAKTMEVGVEMLPLIFSQSLQVRSLTLVEPQITLLSTPGGKWNFSSLGAKEAKKTPAAKPPAVSIGVLKIVDGKLAIGRAGRGGKTRVYEDVQLTAKNVSMTSPVEFELQAKTPSGGKLHVEGEAGPLDAKDAARSPIEAEVHAEGVDLGATGFLDPSSGIGGKLDLTVSVKSDGKEARAEGTAKTAGLKLARGGQPARQPVTFEFATDYEPQRNAGTLSKGDIKVGSSAAKLSGNYDTRGESAVVHLKLRGEQMKVDDVSGLLPAFGVIMPPGSSLQGGVASANLSIDGPLDRLVITGPLNVSATRLAGYDLGSKMGALAAFSGMRTGSTTEIQTLSSGLRVAPDGIRADNINLVAPALGSVTGAGTIGANNSLNFRMVAKLAQGGGLAGGLSALSTFGQSKGAIPFMIQGTTSNPVFVPDVAGAMGQTVGAPVTGAESILGLFGKKKKQQ